MRGGMRNAMPEQPADVRNKNFQEVALGYTKEMAVDEAQRCLNCPKPRCVGSCPVNIDIPKFIHEVAQENFAEAYKILKQKSTLPAVCGRVCPQENQCEGKCVLGIKGEPVAIGRLERFVADYAREHGLDNDVEAPAERKGKKVAVVGSGPSGLTCAGDLAKMGYDVTMYEALHAAGGVLMYGIPQFRLPKEIVQHEISALKKLGVKIVVDAVIGRTFTIKELMEEEGFSAVYVGTGAGLPHFMQIDGENLNGVYSANEFLTRVNLMKAYEFPNYATPVYVGKKAAIVGAGNVAMDAARTAKRLGAEQVYIVYRRSEEEMPARKEEIGHAKEEGIELRLLNNPVAILGDEKGWVNGLKCIKMELGEPDASGRRSPVATGETFEIPCDLVLSAIGEKVDAKLMAENGIEMGRKGPAFQTNVENVWSAGDAHRGPATVVEGIADAAAFAEAVIGAAHTYEIPEQAYPTKADAIAKKGTLHMAGCAGCEGSRCLDCNTVCENCADSCPNRANVVVKLADGRHEIVHVDKMCNECGNCTQFCPYASEPCHDKFTLFQTAKDMDESENKGVLFLGGDAIRVRLDTDRTLDLSQPNDLPRDIETLILTLRSKYSYLYTE